jgi:putative endonuclease
MYYLYLIECKDKSIYTGITTDVDRRFAEHKNKTGGRYTRAHAVKKVLYTEMHKNRSGASKREAEIKRWPRSKKLALAKGSIIIEPIPKIGRRRS